MRDKTAKRIQNDMLCDRINFPLVPMLKQIENFISREKKDDSVILTTEDLRNYSVEHADKECKDRKLPKELREIIYSDLDLVQLAASGCEFIKATNALFAHWGQMNEPLILPVRDYVFQSWINSSYCGWYEVPPIPPNVYREAYLLECENRPMIVYNNRTVIVMPSRAGVGKNTKALFEEFVASSAFEWNRYMAGTMRTEKTKVNEMIGRYLLALGKIQDQMFEHYNGEGSQVYANFYDLGALDGLNVQERIYLYSKKYRFAYVLLEGKYYETIKCLWDVICLNPEDLNAWFLVMRWSIFLEEWDILDIILSKEDKTPKSTSDGTQILIECVRLVHKLHTVESRLQPDVASDIAGKLKEIIAFGKKTFLFSHCQAILRSALVQAARLPKADLQKLGDPLHNRTCETDICEVILRNRLPSFFKCDQSSSVHKKSC
uniref:F-box domain-containing protein n=1 Tax=Ditylenchus dipsaci TaxID=166011 RepID=A0A915DYZ2_9BILA